MTRRPAPLVAILVLVTGAALAGYLLIVPSEGEDFSDNFLLPAAVIFTAVGALIIARSDGNRIGWVASAAGLAFLANVVAVNSAFWFSFFFLVGLLIYWFPTGRPLSPRWRWVGWMGLLGWARLLAFIVWELPKSESGSPPGVSLVFLDGFVLLSVVSLIVRWVRARGVERLQIKWFTFAVVFLIGVNLLAATIGNLLSISELVLNLVSGLAVLALPVAIGVAVLRYRLYEIDRIVSRTVSYTLVVGLLGLVFFGVVSVLTSLLSAESDLAVAGSTLAVAALFNPLRRRVQAGVDRRFNRSRYDAQKVMDAFSGSLRDRVDPDGVIEGWVGAVSETMQPATVAVWVREGHS